MPEESTTPDLVERVRRQFEALNRRDIDAVMSSVAVHAVLEGRALGDIFEGQAAIRAFAEGWFGMYEELEYELEEVHELGNGVVFAVVLQEARPAGIAGHVRQREGWVYVWTGGLIARLSIFAIDEARAVAERLAEERGQATSAENVELARRFIEAFGRGDVNAVLSLLSPDVVYRPITTFTDARERRGLDGFRRFMDEFGEAWRDDFAVQPETIREYGDALIALTRFTGHARTSGIEISGGSSTTDSKTARSWRSKISPTATKP